MLKWTKGGLLISGDEMGTHYGKVICEMSDEIARLHREVQWWRASALGHLWNEAIKEMDGEEPFL